nr:hypothetical protein [uncultured Devosia sp.]
MPVRLTNAFDPSTERLIQISMAVGIAGLSCFPSLASESTVRELDAYCITAEGTRMGVAASQDGATNTYVWPHGADMEITRSAHNRMIVSLWHRELDLIGFDSLTSHAIPPPHCAIAREEQGQYHVVRWPEGQTPPSLAAVFAAMLVGSSTQGRPVR